MRVGERYIPRLRMVALCDLDGFLAISAIKALNRRVREDKHEYAEKAATLEEDQEPAKHRRLRMARRQKADAAR